MFLNLQNFKKIYIFTHIYVQLILRQFFWCIFTSFIFVLKFERNLNIVLIIKHFSVYYCITHVTN